jgi:hypothetical protein
VNNLLDIIALYHTLIEEGSTPQAVKQVNYLEGCSRFERFLSFLFVVFWTKGTRR